MSGIAELLQGYLVNQSLGPIGLIGVAFVGGFLSSLLPCTLSMLPLMVGYIGGYDSQSKWDVLRQVGLFVLGVALIMTILGVAATLLGVTFGGLIGEWWYYALGALVIVLGLSLLGVIHIPLPQFANALPKTKTGRWLTPLMMGLTFGLTASPCGTPFLAAILGFISTQNNVALGAASLFAYAVGQCTILLVVGLFTGLLKYLNSARQFGVVLNKVSGYLFILAGLILFAQPSGLFGQILAWLHLI